LLNDVLTPRSKKEQKTTDNQEYAICKAYQCLLSFPNMDALGIAAKDRFPPFVTDAMRRINVANGFVPDLLRCAGCDKTQTFMSRAITVKVDDFSVARSRLMMPLPWLTFAPPFSHIIVKRTTILSRL